MYGGYYADDDYNPMRHMMDDPVDFQMHGYGGFGYDTSDVPKDEPKPTITKKADAGDLAGVKSVVEKTPANKKAHVINHARRWTEVDYRMSGFTKEYEWFDITPVATAAWRGHDQIVQYLLEQGADPTLVGCPTDDVHRDAFQSAEAKIKVEDRNSKGPKSEALLRAKRCVDLLTAAKPFWNPASYNGSRYGKNARTDFTNKPTNTKELLDALSSIPALPQDKSGAAEAKKKKPAAPNVSSGGSTVKHTCVECKEDKSKSEYSRNQWSKGSDKGKCKDCIDSSKKNAPAAASVRAQREDERSEEETLGDMLDGLMMMSADTVLHLTEMSAAIDGIKNRTTASYKCSNALCDSLETLEIATRAAELQLVAISGMVVTAGNIAARDGRIKRSSGGKKLSPVDDIHFRAERMQVLGRSS